MSVMNEIFISVQGYYSYIYNVVESNMWFIEASIVLCVAWLALSFWKLLHRKSLDFSVSKKSKYLQYTVEASRRPVELMIGTYAIVTSMIVSLSQFSIDIKDALLIVRGMGLLTLFMWFVLRFTSRCEKAVLSGQIFMVNKTRFSTLMTVSRVVIYFMFFLLGLQVLGFSLSGLLAFGSVGALVIGFASKTFLENALGYLTVTSSRKFEIGDDIRVDGSNVAGVVESITLPSTVIRDVEKRLVHIPNGIFINQCVINVSKMDHRRVSVEVPVLPEHRLELINVLKNIRKVLGKDERVDQNLRILCNVSEYSAVNGYFIVVVDFYTKGIQIERFFGERQDFIFMIFNMMDSMSVPVALSRTQEFQVGSVASCKNDSELVESDSSCVDDSELPRAGR
jgi:MscS family membrane protein